MNRTKRAIVDTFWQLLDEKPFNVTLPEEFLYEKE